MRAKVDRVLGTKEKRESELSGSYVYMYIRKICTKTLVIMLFKLVYIFLVVYTYMSIRTWMRRVDAYSCNVYLAITISWDEVPDLFYFIM